MKIFNISQQNVARLPQNYNATSIAFGDKNDDKSKGILYAQDFSRSISSMTYQDFYENLEKIYKENDAVKQSFVTWKPHPDGNTIFGLAIKEDGHFAEDIFDMVKSCYNETHQKFLFGTNPEKYDVKKSPFYQAVEAGYTDLAYDIVDWVSKFASLPIKKKFFTDEMYQVLIDSTDKHTNMENVFLEAKHKFLGIPSVSQLFLPPPANMSKVNGSKPPIKSSGDDASDEVDGKKKENTRFKVIKEPQTRFEDVGGMFNVKRQIQQELITLLKNPRVKASDKPGGVLLEGPPGTGKTLLATAIAGEAGIPFVATNGAAFAEIYVGAGPKHVRELYAEAREVARSHPSKTAIVFIDEVDAIAGKRNGSGNNNERESTLNQILSELDGVASKEKSDVKIITIAATNRKELLDEAFLRAGRMDLQFTIDDPSYSEKARREILNIHAKDRPFKNEEDKEKILKDLAKSSSGMSGAELADLMKRAYRFTLYPERDNTPYITQKDVTDAKLEMLAGIKTDMEALPETLKVTIAHEGGHALNIITMNDVFKDDKDHRKMPNRQLDFIVNESHGGALGIMFSKPTVAQSNPTVETLISEVVLTYGGYSMESAVFGCHDAGVSQDLKVNTNRIITAVTQYGLGSKTKFIGCTTEGATFELFKSDIKKDIEDYSNFGMKISTQIAEFTKQFIEEYSTEFADPNSQKDKILQGDVFEKMFREWLDKTGKTGEYNQLCKDIRAQVEEFRNKL